LRETLIGGRNIETVVTLSPEEEGRDVVLAAGGNPEAFERLYRFHQRRVYSLSVRMAGPEWAEDLTQEVFIRAWSKLGTFRGDSSFGTWLYRLAVNLILSRRETLRRREQRQHPESAVLDRMHSRPDKPGMALDLEAAIQRLPQRAREVFVLYEVEGYPHDEIAKMTGISPGTSKSQLHRARMILRDFLKA
jgi:RNA polymerase sigma-70 factor (ECF subfamily)